MNAVRDQTAQLRKDLEKEREKNNRPNDEQTDGRSKRKSERDEMPCYKMDARPRGNQSSFVVYFFAFLCQINLSLLSSSAFGKLMLPQPSY